MSDNCMSQPITMKEIEAAIKQLKCKKAPGPDGATNDMIKHLGPAAKKTLLDLFNESWKNGTVPALWKKATIIPIHKIGTDKKDPNSYRPISLLSCLAKLLERVINRRLISFLEEQKILSPTQTGYRKHRSTEDQLALIAQEIENAFQEKRKIVSVFFDLTKAFDKVWREGLLLKTLESGVSGRMYRWIRYFLHNRSARVKLDGHLSKSVKMRGVPQGGVISLTLFLLYINIITTVLPRHVSNTLYADDLAVWSSSEYTTSSAYRIQEAVNKVEQWTNDWGLQISEVKTQATVFSLSISKEKVAIKLGDKTLPQVETPTFLGVKLDTQLSWKPHIEDMEKKGIKKLAVLKKLSGTHWGANSKILKLSTWEPSGPLWNMGPAPGRQQPRRTPTNWTKFRTSAWGQSLVPWKPLPQLKWRRPLELNHLRAGDRPNFSSMQKRWRGCQTTPCTKSSKTLQKKKKQIEKEKSEPPSKRTAERTCRHPYNWCTPVWKTEPKQLATRNPTCWDQNNPSWHHFKGKPKSSTIQQHPGHTSTLMAQLKTPQETEDVVLTSSAQAHLHYLYQHLVEYCAQTTELKS